MESILVLGYQENVLRRMSLYSLVRVNLGPWVPRARDDVLVHTLR